MKTLLHFAWPLAFVIAGLALFVLAVMAVVDAFRGAGKSFSVPGETTITVARPGDYTLWQEDRTLVDGRLRTFPETLPSGLTVEVTRVPEGTPVEVRPYWGATMTTPSASRRSVAAMTFTAPGDYRVAVPGLEEERLFYIGEDVILRTIQTVLLCGGTGLLLILAGIGFEVYVLVRLVRRRRQQPATLMSHGT